MNFNIPCNPWLSVNIYKDPFFYGDWVLLNRNMQSILKNHETYPEPYSGDPNSNVLCLNLNPGEKDILFESIPANKKRYGLLMEQTLLGKAKNSLWYQLKDHSGYCWLMDKTRTLWESLHREPKIFMVEFFPYHSQNALRFPSYLPSYTFSDCLIKEAMDKDKIIIIMRYEQGWYKRIPTLKTYNKLIVLKSFRSGKITKNNIDTHKSKIGYAQLLKAL